MQAIKFYWLIWIVKNTLFVKSFGRVSTAVIIAQAIHETGNFSSKIFRENKNLFGMKESKATPGGFIEIGTKNGHAEYKNHFDSIRDYFVRQRQFKISGESDLLFMATTVKSGYAEDDAYYGKWKKLSDDFKSKYAWFKPLGWMVIGTLVLVIGRYVFGIGKKG